MTLGQFRCYLLHGQLPGVLQQGVCLAQRWENGHCVRLCHLAGTGRGFFVEVGYGKGRDCSAVLSSFTSPVPLQQYPCAIQLPQR